MPQTKIDPRPTKVCAECRRTFMPERDSALYCSPRCRVRAHRTRRRLVARPTVPQRPPFTGRLIDPADWHPSRLYAADLALRRGVSLRYLNLSERERSALIVGSRQFPYEVRREHAAKIAAVYGWAKSEDDAKRLSEERAAAAAVCVNVTPPTSDVELAIMDALGRAAWEPCSELLTGKGGRPAHISAWIPALAPWDELLDHFLPWWLRRARRPSEDDAMSRRFSLSAPIGEEGGRTLADVIADTIADGDLPPGVPRIRGRALADPHTGYADPPRALRGTSPAYAEALGYRMDSGKLSNPGPWAPRTRRGATDSGEAASADRHSSPRSGMEPQPGKDREDDVSAWALIDGRDDVRAIRNALEETNRRLEELASLVIYTKGETPTEAAERFLAEDDAA